MISSAFVVCIFATFATGSSDRRVGPTFQGHEGELEFGREVVRPEGELVHKDVGQKGFHRECGDLPIIANADFAVDGIPPYPDGTKLSYTCKDGFEREGRTNYTCSSGVWGVDFRCNQIKNCGPFPAVANLSLSISLSLFVVMLVNIMLCT